LVHFPSYRFHTRLAGARARRAVALPITFAWLVTGTGSTTNCVCRRALRDYSDFLGGNTRDLERGWSAGLRWATDWVAALPGSPLEVT
jgi:hypothetical protein